MPFEIQINTRETETLEKPVQLVNFFSRIALELKYDSLASTFQFEYLFDANKQDHTEIAGVSHYHEAIISYIYPGTGKKKKVLTGFVLNQNFVDAPVPEILPIAGYSKPGTLDDCDIPTSIPLESSGRKLSDIIRDICRAYNLGFVVKTARANTAVATTNENAVEGEIKKTASKTSENAASYIKRLCLMKNIVLTHDEEGRVVVKTANTESEPVLRFDADSNPGVGYTRMSLNYDGQQMFRDITVVRQADDENGNGSISSPLRNPFCPVAAVPRFKVEVQTSGDDVTVGDAARNFLSKSLKAIVLTISIESVTENTALILPDNTIFVKNKKLNLFKMTKFFIEKVSIDETPDKTTQTLTCVLPWVYNYYAKSADGKKTGPYNVFIEPGQNFPTS